jgi:NAD(P)H-nitrite reductase large subunit
MDEKIEGAIRQRDKTTYAIVPRTPVGLLTPEIMERIAMVARKYQVPVTKITSGQRLALVGLAPDNVESAWADLEMGVGRATELCLHYVQACPGNQVCQFGTQDSLELGLRLEEFYTGIALPAKVKIGVSGCPFCCAESLMRDVGLIGRNSGWTVSFGGNAGARPRIGDVLEEKLTEADAIDLVHRCLTYYQGNARKKERTARFIERTGQDALRQALGLP